MGLRRAGPVVAGVDGSEASAAAVNLAAWEAERRGVPLRLVHGYTPPVVYTSYGLAAYPELYAHPQEGAKDMLAKAAGRVHERRPGVDVVTALVAGWPAGVLVDESMSADLVVVGSRGLGGFAGLVVGSVGTQLTAHARCPVIVVRPAEHADESEQVAEVGARPVMVGVDGSPAGRAALGFAFQEANARQVPLVALYAWWMLPLGNLGPVTLHHYDAAEAAEEARRLLAEAVAGWAVSFPDVVVEQRPAHQLDPAQTLIDASEEAGLLVVGRHGGGTVSRLLLGSIGDALVRLAPCPVAVVPAEFTVTDEQ